MPSRNSLPSRLGITRIYAKKGPPFGKQVNESKKAAAADGYRPAKRMIHRAKVRAAWLAISYFAKGVSQK